MPVTVRGGAFCSPAGETGQSSAGSTLVCAPSAGGRNRWQKPGRTATEDVDHQHRLARRRLLNEARKHDLHLPRNTPDALIQEAIKLARSGEAAEPIDVEQGEPVTADELAGGLAALEDDTPPLGVNPQPAPVPVRNEVDEPDQDEDWSASDGTWRTVDEVAARRAAEDPDPTPDQLAWAARTARGEETGPPPPATSASAEKRVRDAYAEVAAGREYVSLAEVRARLGDMPRGVQDAALAKLMEEPGVRIEPESHQRRIGPAERDAALSVGGEDRHLIRMDGPTAGTRPVQPAQPPVTASAPAAPARVANPTVVGGQVAVGQPSKPYPPQDWGNREGMDSIRRGNLNYHKDGAVGLAVERLGEDGHTIHVGGKPLGEHLGSLVTREVDRDNPVHPQATVAEVRRIADALPDGRAKRQLGALAERLDGPELPSTFRMPEGTNPVVSRLFDELASVPAVRRDPAELRGLMEQSRKVRAGRAGVLVASALRSVALNRRHESEEGKAWVDLAVKRAIAEVEKS